MMKSNKIAKKIPVFCRAAGEAATQRSAYRVQHLQACVDHERAHTQIDLLEVADKELMLPLAALITRLHFPIIDLASQIHRGRRQNQVAAAALVLLLLEALELHHEVDQLQVHLGLSLGRAQLQIDEAVNDQAVGSTQIILVLVENELRGF
jgi:hypothetical protein